MMWGTILAMWGTGALVALTARQLNINTAGAGRSGLGLIGRLIDVCACVLGVLTAAGGTQGAWPGGGCFPAAVACGDA